MWSQIAGAAVHLHRDKEGGSHDSGVVNVGVRYGSL